MNTPASLVLHDASERRVAWRSSARRAPAWLALVVCGCLLTQPSAEIRAQALDASAPNPPAVSGQLPPAVWRPPGRVFVVELAVDPSVGATPSSAMQHYAIGVVALPVSVLQPQVAVVLPFYLLFAAPWQAVFNARADRLARALVAQPLPDAVVRALHGQWPQAPALAAPAASASASASSPAPAPVLQVTLRLADYGLMTRSGRKLEAFDSAEDLCLVADGVLELWRDGHAPVAEDIAIGPRSTTRDAPPPLCAPLSRWAADDGLLLRRATREMAELLAALIVDRAGPPP